MSRNTLRKYVDAEGEPRRREAGRQAHAAGAGRGTCARITGTLVREQSLREGQQVGSTMVRGLSGREWRARHEVYVTLVWRAGDGGGTGGAAALQVESTPAAAYNALLLGSD